MFAFVVLGLVFPYQAKRLAPGNVSKITYFSVEWDVKPQLNQLIVCCRLLDVVSAQRTHHELHIMLIFEHVDQDLAQYLEKNASGLSPERIQACNTTVNHRVCFAASSTSYILTHTTIQWPLVRDYPGRLVPEETFTHSHPPDRRASFIDFLHSLLSIASSLFSLRAWQSFSTTCLQVLFGFSTWSSYTLAA